MTITTTMRLYLYFLSIFILLSAPVYAQTTYPYDSCTAGQIHQFRTIGGAQNPDSGYMLVCNGAQWRPVLEWDTATGSSLRQVGYDPAACTNEKEGRLRYSSAGTPPYEYCDGDDWRPFESAASGGCDESGLFYGGHCWYAGQSGQHCTQICASHGGYNNATSSFSGSDGSNANCEALMIVFSGATDAYDGSINCGTQGGGCVYRESTASVFRCATPPTTATAAASGHRRFCACNS